MTTYKVKTGHDVALISLDEMTPQPRSRGVQYARRTVAADGSVYDEGPYIILRWSVIGTAAEYVTLLTQFGLHSGGATSAGVTVYVPNEFRTMTRYNGRAVRPDPGRDVEYENYFYRNLEIVVKALEPSA